MTDPAIIPTPRRADARPHTPTGIVYEDAGTGDVTLLFLPGWCGPSTLFQPLTSRLDDAFRTLSLDWRGHGDSAPASGEFGMAELCDDAVSVIDHSDASTVVPVSIAHAGWIAIELRRRLGPDRIPAIVLLDWMVLGAPGPFVDGLAAMADPSSTRAVVDRIGGTWEAGLEIPALSSYVTSMMAFPDEMWARAARAIAQAFDDRPVPLEGLAALDPPPPTLHLYAQPDDPSFLAAQEKYASTHPWFSAERLAASSHFPMFEDPQAITDRMRRFLGRV